MKFKKITVLTLITMMIASILTACETEQPLLKDKYAEYYNVGVALSKNTVNSYSDEIMTNFNIIVAENEMKWESIQPNEGQFRYTSADLIVEKAEELGAEVRGHVLVWHSQTPSWVFRGDLDDVRERMFTHIENVVGNYKGRISEWDVVNEVLSDSSDPNELFRQDSGWYEACGKDDDVFIQLLADAFKKAKEVDPDLMLYYNDYNLNQQIKREKCVTLVEKLIESGAPIDGVGMQGHYDYQGLNIQDVEDSMDAFIELGMKVAITELDLSAYTWNYSGEAYSEFSKEQEKAQAEVFAQIYEVARDRKDDVTSIITWGVADDYTWKDNFPVMNRKDYPLLFDVFSEPKEALNAILDFE